MSGAALRARSRAPDGDPPRPPVEGDDGGGGGSGWVLLLRAPNDIEAHLLAGRLGEAGVEARLVREKGAPSAWLYGGSNTWAPMSVMVRQRQLDDARLVLAEVSFESPAHAPEVTAERGWRVPVVWWATALTLGVLVTGAALAEVADAVFARCRVPIFCSND